MKSRGSFLFVVGSLSWAVAQWFLVWLFARFAGGAVAVGEYSLALAVTTPVFILGNFGLRTIFLTFIERHSWRTYMNLRFSGIALSVCILLTYLLFTSTNEPWIWVALIFQKSVDAYLDLQNGRIQRVNGLRQIGLLGLLKTVGTMIVAAVLIVVTQSVALAIMGAGLVSLIVATLARRVGVKMTEKEDSSNAGSGYRSILRAAYPITATEALASVSNYLPLLFLGFIADEAAAGTFAAASYLFSAAHIVGGILRNVSITSLRLTYEEQGPGRLFRRSHRIAMLLGALGLGAAPIIIFAGSPVLEFLYGAEFSFSLGELTLLAFAALGIAPSYIYNALLSIVNRYDSQAWSLLSSVLFGTLVGIGMVLSGFFSAMIVALGVAFAANWGRLLGVLVLSLIAQPQEGVK